MLIDGSDAVALPIARGIATHIARPAGLDVDIRLSGGTPDILARLREGNGQQFAILPADVAEAYAGAAMRGSIEAGQLMAPLRALAPLHESDIHFLVRSSSPLNFVHEIEGARINLGRTNSSSALTVSLLFRLMFDTAISVRQASFHSHPEALVKLLEETIDVVAFVSPYPARLLADMKPEARRYVKLLKLDASHPATERLRKIYSSRLISAAAYPNLLDEDVPTLTVSNYLVSHGRSDVLQARFAHAWCRNLPKLRNDLSPLLQGLESGLPPLVSGWNYSRPFERELLACLNGGQAIVEDCPQDERVLGVCAR